MRRRDILLAGGASLLAACQRDSKKQIGVVPKGRAHQFWQSVHAGAVKASRESAVEIIWNGPDTETDYNGQIRIVDALINRRVDAICLAPIDKKVMVSVVDRAAAQKIPVVIFDSGIDTDKYVTQVSTDNYKAGELGAQRMGELLGGKGKIVVVAVQPGADSTMQREAGFEDGIRKNFAGIEILDKRYGMADFAKSLAVTENMLTAFPTLDALFASNESSSVGAAQALKARGSKVKMVGFDWSQALLEDVRAGLIDSLVVQHPFKMGYESVLSAVKALRGETVPKQSPITPRLVTRQNLDEPDIKEQLNPDLKQYLG